MFGRSRTDKVEDEARSFRAVAADEEAREHLRTAVREALAAVRRADQVRKREEHRGRRTFAALLVVLAGAAAYLWYWMRRDDEEPYEYTEHAAPAGGYASGPGEADADVTGTSAEEVSTFTSTHMPGEPPVTPATEGIVPAGIGTAAAGAAASEAAAGAPTAGPADPEALPQQHQADETQVIRPGGDLDRDRLLSLRGSDVVDRGGAKIGTLQEVFLDDDSGRPEWALVGFGTLHVKLVFVPLRGATVEDDNLRVDVDADQAKNAPTHDGEGHLSQEQEDELYRHYGVERGSRSVDSQ
jgi:sporulation protein YlmC with PRC-barrel domain